MESILTDIEQAEADLAAAQKENQRLEDDHLKAWAEVKQAWDEARKWTDAVDAALVRIVQCHMYPMQVPQMHPLGFATLSTVDGLVASEVLSEVHALRDALLARYQPADKEEA